MMPVFFLRLIGRFTGFVFAHWMVHRFLLISSGGEGVIAEALWFWFGGWIVVLFYYATGITIGFWGSVPFVNLIGRLIQRVSRSIEPAERRFQF